jgi:hypothetical protein
MKNLFYLPIALVLLIAASCGSQQNTVAENKAETTQPETEKNFVGVMAIKDSIKLGDSVLLRFTARNATDTTSKFLKWQTPFEPLMSKYLDIKDENGNEVNYKGAMAKRMMPPPADAYLTVNSKDSLVATVDVLKGYDLSKPGVYTITYTSENVSGLKVPQSVKFVYR